MEWASSGEKKSGWRSEDELKVEAAKSLEGLSTSRDVAEILEDHGIVPLAATPPQDTSAPNDNPSVSNDKNNGKKQQRDRIKSFFQHAYAAVEKGDDGKLIPGLRYEFLVVKVLRVLALLILVLYAVMLASMAIRIRRIKWPNQLGTFAVGTLCAFLIIHLLLWLWSEQSKRYYRRVAHAYLVVAAPEDKALLDRATLAPPDR